MPLQSFNIDNELAKFFTDAEYLREVFKNSVAASTLPKRILIIHGVGGVGKSSLLRMYRLYCKSIKVPVALVSGDDAKSALNVLVRLADDLKAENIVLSSFGKTFRNYGVIQTKVEEYAKRTIEAPSRTVDIAGKVASKTAEAAGGALAGAAIGSIIPGIGTAIGGVLGGVLGGMGAEALTDWLRGFLTKPEIGLLIDPMKKLTDDFLADVVKIAEKRRIVLMIDTFEQMPALEDWVRDVAQQLPANLFLVIAGRAIPNWSREWQGWMANAQIEELKPMNEDDMRDLVRRYYAMILDGEPNPMQVQTIIRFAHGLPMVVTGAVQLWVKYGVEDFQSVKPEIVANLVDRLMEGVPSALIPSLEAAAAVRWFDKPILRAVTGFDDVREVHDELRRFPFVRTRAEGFALHDAVREIIDENLHVQDSERHCELHKRAAEYFEKRMEKATGEESVGLWLERLYHLIRADEEAGIKLFREMAEELSRNYLVGRFRIVLNDVNTYSLDSQNSRLWREYYNARLRHINVQFSEAAETYITISKNEHADPKLQAYALCDLSQIWTRNFYLSQSGGLERALAAIEKGQQLIPEMDSKLALNFTHLRAAYMFKGELDKAVDALNQQCEYYKKNGDKKGIVYSLDMLKDIFGLLGDWSKASGAEKEGLNILATLPSNPFLVTRLVGNNIWYKVWSGQYSEAERGMRQALALAEKEEQVDSIPSLYRDLGFVLGLQGRWKQSQEYFSESVKKYQDRFARSTGLGGAYGFRGLIFAQQGDFERAEEHLMDSLSIKKEIGDNNGVPEVLVWMGKVYEMMAQEARPENQDDFFSKAESYYYQSLDYIWTSRRHFECSAFTGLMRVKYAKREYGDIIRFFNQAEETAQKYGYHDLLASLYLYKGHIQWLGLAESWPNGFDTAELSYKQAILHALRYNRFLLDEIVLSDQFSTPLINIVSQCLMQGPSGRRMLEILVNWWETAIVDTSLDIFGEIFSLEMNGIQLTQAEKLARQKEPGDGVLQPSITEIINTFLNSN